MKELYSIDDIQFMVSMYCPGMCQKCNIWRQKKEDAEKDEIDLLLFERALQSDALRNTSHFDLTGGESQLSPRYTEVVKLIAWNKPDAFIHTNISGWYPERHFAITKECLNYVDQKNFRIDISLDGRPENYRKIRLVRDGFRKAVKTAELLKPLGIHLRFVMAVHQENYKDIEWFVNFARETGIGHYIGFARYSTGYFKNKDKDTYFTKEEISEIEHSLNRVEWLTERRLPNWLWAKSVYERSIPFFACYMGEMAIVIDPYGNVYPCNELLPELKMGDLKEFGGSMDGLLFSEKALRVLSYIQKKKCQPCGMLCALKMEFPWGKQTGLLPVAEGNKYCMR